MNLEKITFEKKQDLAFVGFGKYEEKSMTTLCQKTLEELSEVVGQIDQNQQDYKGVVFFSHKKDVFLAGVEISLIQSLKTEADAQLGSSRGQGIFNQVEDLKIPTLALVDGICLGGGMELALSCDKIGVSESNKTKLGLPEVMLGVLPGFGGCYRMPKKIGLTSSLDLILSGRQVNWRKAVKLGLAEFAVPSERLLELGPSYMHKSGQKKDGLKENIESLAEHNFITRKIIFQKAREKILEKTKGLYPAPLKILDLLEKGHSKSREAFLLLESQYFAELSQTIQSKSLLNVFFLTDESKKKKETEQPLEMDRGAVLGAGTMGGGIAWLLAKNNMQPIMKDLDVKALELGLDQASKNFSQALKRRRLTKDKFNQLMRSITPSLNYGGFRSVDLVIEAIVEDMGIKKKVLSELETKVSEQCVITSNTSSLSIGEMASALERPERFAGLHFFNPVNKMPLVEIISHDKADPQVINGLYNWVLKCRKTPVIVNDGPGFLVNRILGPYINEGAYLVEQGYSIEEIDEVAEEFGMPMGPCRLMDEVGLDVGTKVGNILMNGLGERFAPSKISTQLIDKGLLGKKNQKGFYLYDEAGKKKEVNSEVVNLFFKDKKLDRQQSIHRMILPMINEAASVLADKIIDSPMKIDLALIYGIGFPPFRGGLLKYCDDKGGDKILGQLKSLADDVDPIRFKVNEYFESLVKEKKKFYSL